MVKMNSKLEILDEPADQADAARGYKSDADSYLSCHHPKMRNRMLSYARWPIQFHKIPRDVAKSGFDYVGEHNAAT